MGILNALGINADVAAETEQARKEIEWLVECAMASLMGNLTNENGLIPYTVNTLDNFVKHTLGQLDGWEADITIGGQTVGKVVLRKPR